MILDGFDVEAYVLTDAAAAEISPGVMLQGWYGDAFALYAPTGHPDGRVAVWTVPAGVTAITFQLFGAQGGASFGFSYDPDDYLTPVVHTRRFAVTPGDEIAMAAGGPAYDYDIALPTRGNGPIWGGQGSFDSTWACGAGGGASALWLNGTLVALGPGSGGWAFDYSVTGTAVPPSTSFPSGSAGSISRGLPSYGVVGEGGGGGGAPGGAGGGSYGSAGGNGATVTIAADSGGPESPMWGTETTIAADYHSGADSGVRIFYYQPTTSSWSIDEIKF